MIQRDGCRVDGDVAATADAAFYRGGYLAIEKVHQRSDREMNVAAIRKFRLRCYGTVLAAETVIGYDGQIPRISEAGTISRDKCAIGQLNIRGSNVNLSARPGPGGR